MDLNIKGIDISNYQGNFDFNLLKLSGVEVCIIESGDGITFTNPYLEQQYNGIKEAGIKIGFYHFFRVEDDCIAQANAFWNRIKDKEFGVYPVLDVELTMGVSNINEAVESFIEEFKKISGYECIIYTYTNFANLYLNESLGIYKCWLADYGVANMPCTIFKNYVGWQYTDIGKINGLSNTFDLDKFNSNIFISSVNEKRVKMINTSQNIEPLWEKCVQGQIVKNLQYELDIQFGDNLVVDGYFGKLTLGACINVYEGSEGEITKIMQQRLVEHGFYIGPTEVDGIFGLETLQGLENFQASRQLNIDGVCGKQTWEKLMLLS